MSDRTITARAVDTDTYEIFVDGRKEIAALVWYSDSEKLWCYEISGAVYRTTAGTGRDATISAAVKRYDRTKK